MHLVVPNTKIVIVYYLRDLIMSKGVFTYYIMTEREGCL